jgi:hypothetical protein
VADFDEPPSEATLSLYLRKLVQAEIDRSFKLGLTAPARRASDIKTPCAADSEMSRARGRSRSG